MKTPWVTLFLLVISWGLNAQEMRILYLEGTVEAQIHGQWVDADIGDSLSPGSSLRLGQNSKVEFSAQGLRLILTSPGVHPLADVVKRWRERGVWENSLALKLQKLSGNSPKGATASMAVRGSSVGEYQAPFSTREALVTLGEEALAKGDVARAKGAFSEALEASISSEDEAGAQELLGLCSLVEARDKFALQEWNAVLISAGQGLEWSKDPQIRQILYYIQYQTALKTSNQELLRESRRQILKIDPASDLASLVRD